MVVSGAVECVLPIHVVVLVVAVVVDIATVEIIVSVIENFNKHCLP